MASYHCTVKSGGKGRAGPHSDYIEREGKYAPELAQGKSKLEDLEHKASGNMPAWAEHDAGIFWRAADEFERANGATYREIEIALPRELTPDQRLALVEDFITQQIGDQHAFTFAIHIPKATIEKGDQPHCHLMYSERTLDGIDRDPAQYFKRANSKNPAKGGCKKDSAGTKERLLATRELWAKVQNDHLANAGCEDRVSHLSLKARGIDRAPEKHLGPIDAKKINAPALVKSRNLERELVQVRKEVAAIDVTAELAAQREAQAAIAKASTQARADQVRVQDLEIANLAKQEKEDESIRTTTLAALRKSSAATDRVIAFTQSEHERTSQSLGAASANLGRALEGAQRRVARSYIEISAPAVAKQLAAANHILQQLVDRLPNLVKSIAVAASAIATRALEALITRRVADRKAKEAPAKAPEQSQRAAQAPAKAIARATPARTPSAVLAQPSPFDTGLTSASDLHLVKRAKDLFAQAQPSYADRNSLRRDVGQAMYNAAQAARTTEPRRLDAGQIERTAKGEQNTRARLSGQHEPWPENQSTCYWDTMVAIAAREKSEHLATPRPGGLFSGDAKKAYDEKTAKLEGFISKVGPASAVLQRDLQQDIAERVAAHANQDATQAPQHALNVSREMALAKLEKAIKQADLAHAPRDQRQEKVQESRQDRKRGSDFER